MITANTSTAADDLGVAASGDALDTRINEEKKVEPHICLNGYNGLWHRRGSGRRGGDGEVGGDLWMRLWRQINMYEQRGVFFLMVVMVKYDIRGVCRAFPTHTHEHFWDIKRHFCGLRICGSLVPKNGQQMRRIAESQNRSSHKWKSGTLY
jgi:hypothetical protein